MLTAEQSRQQAAQQASRAEQQGSQSVFGRAASDRTGSETRNVAAAQSHWTEQAARQAAIAHIVAVKRGQASKPASPHRQGSSHKVHRAEQQLTDTLANKSLPALLILLATACEQAEGKTAEQAATLARLAARQDNKQPIKGRPQASYRTGQRKQQPNSRDKGLFHSHSHTVSGLASSDALAWLAAINPEAGLANLSERGADGSYLPERRSDRRQASRQASSHSAHRLGSKRNSAELASAQAGSVAASAVTVWKTSKAGERRIVATLPALDSKQLVKVTQATAATDLLIGRNTGSDLVKSHIDIQAIGDYVSRQAQQPRSVTGSTSKAEQASRAAGNLPAGSEAARQPAQPATAEQRTARQRWTAEQRSRAAGPQPCSVHTGRCWLAVPVIATAATAEQRSAALASEAAARAATAEQQYHEAAAAARAALAAWQGSRAAGNAWQGMAGQAHRQAVHTAWIASEAARQASKAGHRLATQASPQQPTGRQLVVTLAGTEQGWQQRAATAHTWPTRPQPQPTAALPAWREPRCPQARQDRPAIHAPQGATWQRMATGQATAWQQQAALVLALLASQRSHRAEQASSQQATAWPHRAALAAARQAVRQAAGI